MRKPLRKIAKKVLGPAMKKKFESYSKKSHDIEFEGLSITILPGVFPPSFLISTKVLVKYLRDKEIAGKSLLELGCGSGAIACWAAQKGAIVVASDINPQAIECAKLNAEQNGIAIQTKLSDLFKNLPQPYDWIIINPPYYPQEPKNDREKAWFAGKDFDYFRRLFSELSYKKNWAKCIMVLSEDCNLSDIIALAKNEGLNLKKVLTHKKLVEHNYVYEIIKTDAN